MFGKARVYLDVASSPRGNPSAPHAEGRAARERLEQARTDIARLVEAKPDDVIFTSGATEANALAILGSVRATKAEQPHVLYLPSAHASLVENVRALRAEGAVVEPLRITQGAVDLKHLETQVRAETVLVAMEAVCGETGTVWDTRAVKTVLEAVARAQKRVPALLHVDASQAPRTEKITRAHFGADLLTFDGSKVGTLCGVGCLVAPRTIALTPLYYGGGQEREVRSGTPDVLAASALALQLVQVAQARERFRSESEHMRALLAQRITERLRDVYINVGAASAPHILNLSFIGRDTDYLVALLDERGFAVSTRSACETDSADGSRPVYALYADRDRAHSTLRISWGSVPTLRTLRRFTDALVASVLFIDEASAPAHHVSHGH